PALAMSERSSTITVGRMGSSVAAVGSARIRRTSISSSRRPSGADDSERPTAARRRGFTLGRNDQTAAPRRGGGDGNVSPARRLARLLKQLLVVTLRRLEVGELIPHLLEQVPRLRGILLVQLVQRAGIELHRPGVELDRANSLGFRRRLRERFGLRGARLRASGLRGAGLLPVTAFAAPPRTRLGREVHGARYL